MHTGADHVMLVGGARLDEAELNSRLNLRGEFRKDCKGEKWSAYAYGKLCTIVMI